MTTTIAIPRLHVITDEVQQDRYSHVELAEIAVANGSDGIQYREKRALELSTRISVANSMAEVCGKSNAMLIVNDHVEVAAAVSAPAIHLGQEDETVDFARKKLAAGTVIGGTANSLDEAIRVDQLDVDYLGIGPVFGTKSKNSPAPTMGLKTLAEICSACRHPVIAIGNIQLENVEAVMAAGAHGVAVISAICCATDVASATRAFCTELGL